MIFLPTLLSWLAIQYQFSLKELQRDQWLWLWSNWVGKKATPLLGPQATILITLVLPAIFLAAVLAMLDGWFFGLIGWLVTLFVVLYSLGRDDYCAACKEVVESLHNHDLALADSVIKPDDYPQVRERLAYCAYGSWFPVIFWFLILGAPGALFYRMLSIFAQSVAPIVSHKSVSESSDESETWAQSLFHQDANPLLGWFDWLPVRLWALACALAGSFSSGFAIIRRSLLTIETTADFLDSVVVASAEKKESAQSTDYIDDWQTVAADNIDSYRDLNARVMTILLVAVLLLVVFI
ncbi:MAG: hypothetical protein P8H97_03560 [Pseudomonadales bacterium]|nr:hypothetical protein [Pseudomonadales bacterium]